MASIRRPSCLVSSWLLLVMLVLESSQAATLVCDDDSSQPDCHWDISWEEVAQAWNAHDCVPHDKGLSCHWKVDRRHDANIVAEGDASTVRSTSSNGRIQACTQDQELCVAMETVTEITTTTTTATAATATNIGLQESAELEKEVQSVTSSTTTETNGESSRDPTTTPPTDATVTDHHLPHPPGAETSRQEFGIRIGNYVYKEPWDQYAPPLARTLKARRHLWRPSPPQQQQQPQDLTVEYALASAHLDIGIAHFAAVNDEETSPGRYTSSQHSHHPPPLNMDSFDLSLAMNAFVHAQVIYHKLLKVYQGTDQEAVVHSSVAALHLQWGEVYQSPHYFDETDSDGHDMLSEQEAAQKYNDLALKMYEKSEHHYKQSLEAARRHNQEDADAITDTHISLAHVSHRIGRCHINAVQTTNFVSAEDLDLGSVIKGDPEAAETLGASLPQLDQYLRGVAKAEVKFQEAVAIYRAAIQYNQDDFEYRIQLKEYLATTLQDAGTAATYAGNLAKAIELQEEGVALCKEILDHLPETERLVMIQYVGDSLYGLSGNYMQLGRYDETNAKYEGAMEWYETHELEPSNVMAGYEIPDDTMEAYEQQLTDYNDMLREINMPDGYPEDQVMYGPNDAYEADLHGALGSAHLSRHEILMAIDHLKQAIRLYANDESGENLDRFLADTKMSLAAAYFTDGQYKLSAEVHREAMDIYQKIIGEGKNPMLAGLAEKLGMSIEDLGQINAFGAGAELLASQEIQNMIAGLDLDEDLKATLLSLMQAKKTEESNSQGSDPTKSKEKNDIKGVEGKATQKVHEELIDLEKVRRSALNSTSAMEEL